MWWTPMPYTYNLACVVDPANFWYGSCWVCLLLGLPHYLEVECSVSFWICGSFILWMHFQRDRFSWISPSTLWIWMILKVLLRYQRNRSSGDGCTLGYAPAQNTIHLFVVDNGHRHSTKQDLRRDFPWLFCLTTKKTPQIQHWSLLHRSQILLAKSLPIRTWQSIV